MAFGLEEQKAFLVPTWQGCKSPSAQQAHWSAVPMCWDVIICFMSSVDRRSFQLVCFPQEAHVGALRCFLPADRWTTQQAALVQETAHTSWFEDVLQMAEICVPFFRETLITTSSDVRGAGEHSGGFLNQFHLQWRNSGDGFFFFYK